jgi:hypothetical protein
MHQPPGDARQRIKTIIGITEPGQQFGHAHLAGLEDDILTAVIPAPIAG